MSELGEPTPRRALPPRDDIADDLPDDDLPVPRRGEWSATGDPSPAGPGTPIPPPAVLPVPEVAPASAGRRFSAVDLPEDEERPLPRRSALSPAATRARSPRTPDFSESPASPASPAPTRVASAEPPAPRSYRKLALGIIAALVLAALVIAGFLLVTGSSSGRSGSTPAATADAVATHLLQPEDLAPVRPDTTWQAATTVTQPDASTPAAKCLVPVLESEPQPAETLVRTFSPVAGTAAGLLHQVERYATPDEAAAAFTARTRELGSCERNTAWVQGGVQATGLADEASGATVVLQGEEAEYHTILVIRTGTRLNIVDATQADAAPDAATLLPALRAVLERQCGDNGTCPTADATLTPGVPPANEPYGFLTAVDLPRITAGAGTWRGAPVSSSVVSLGSRCEAVDLTTPPAGSVSQQQRTLVLQDDAAAPASLGVDEALYTFNTPEEANSFATTLTTNIDGCAARTGTAEVGRSGDLTGPGTGAAWVITRKVDQAQGTARFRVAVLAAGQHVVYLMVNPTAEFDFADDAWHHVALRAADRLTQLP